MRVIGIDLAWGEGSNQKPANETALVAVDQSGVIVDAAWASGLDHTENWVEQVATDNTLLVVDAPLVVSNASGYAYANSRRVSGMGDGRSRRTARTLARADSQASRFSGCFKVADGNTTTAVRAHLRHVGSMSLRCTHTRRSWAHRNSDMRSCSDVNSLAATIR